MDRITLTYNFDNSCFYDKENKIRFEPPVYEQRYLTVLRLLELDIWKSSFKKIVEFGCAEMKFFTLLKTLPDVEQILLMSAEEFIYSVINTDNVAQLDLNVIANTLASADSLIRQIKVQQVENEGLKEKITSLRTSALQIKQLYEAEVGKNQGIVNREEDYVRKVKELEARTSTAENARINAELQGKETVAELERKADHWRDKYDSLALDMVRNCSLLVDNSLLPNDQQVKFRDWKCHVQSMVQDGKEVPEDVLICLNKKRASRKKRKPDAECRDQGTMTVGPTYHTIGVNAVEEKPPLSTASTSTQDLIPPTPQYSITNDSFSEDKPKEEPPKKTFANKGTMYSSSMVTRSTCTSAFIKRVDVGVNFPEVIPKSINEILRECVIELPSLLSPILDEISVRKESTSTQTDPLPDSTEQKPQLVSTGTVTKLSNIRRKLYFARKIDGSQLLSNIKKEESISPASSMLNLPVTAFQSEDLGGVNPQLTHIWGLLGETMFRLLGTGRMFDSQCYNTINERIAMINNLIDSESLRGTAMMSEVFAAAAASAALASSEKDLQAGKRNVAKRVPTSRGKCMRDYEEQVGAMSGEDNAEGSNGSWDIEGPDANEEIASNVENEPRYGPMDQEEQVDEPNCATEAVRESSKEPETTPSMDYEDAVSNATTTIEDHQPPAEDSKQTKDFQTSTPREDDDPASACQPLVVPEQILPPLRPSSPFVVPAPPLTEDSNDYGALLEPIITDGAPKPKDGDEGQHPPQPEDVENDELEHELRLMEEGSGIQPANILQVPNLVETKHYLDVMCEEESVSTTDDENECRMMIVEASPNRLSSASSSCTSIGSNGTLISPIKVKETNELVKDQFKTPTSPAISKRKLRERLEAGHAKRGRLSPTTECLLEDDWDHKFTRIKDYFTLPSSVNPIVENSAKLQRLAEEDESNELLPYDDWELSPIEQFDEDDDEDEFVASEAPQLQPLTVATGQDEPMSMTSLTDSPESPVEEPSTSLGSSTWDHFKKPLSIDIRDYSLDVDSASDSPESPVLSDSPLSPTPVCQNVVSRQCCSYDESPLSPPLNNRASIYADSVEPKIIPLEHPLASRTTGLQVDDTPIGKSIAWYNNAKRGEVLKKIASKPPKKETQLIQQLVEVIKAYVQDEWTVENVNLRCSKLLEVSEDTRIICHAIVDCVVSYADLLIDVQCSPPAPLLPITTQKLVLLAKTLNKTLFTMDRIMMQEIDRRVFQLKSDKVKLEAITAMTFLYVGMADCNRLYGCTARMYIYKCLYYFNFNGLPLIYYVLKAFPHALPKKTSVHYDNSDAMVSTIRTVLMNTNYSERPGSTNPDAHLFKKQELLKLLKFFYGYQQGCPTYEELITNLVEKIKANKLKNVDYSLILVAKRKGYDWAKQHIVQKHLYPLLNDYLKQIDADVSRNDQICCLIFSISAILKTQPNYQDVTGVMQILGSIVQKTDGNRRVQEAAVAGLMRFTRFSYADVYEWLCRWCPNYDVSGRTKLMLATFVHRKERSFWQQLGQRAFVDIDEELLCKWQHSVRPLMVDYIQRRPNKFNVEVWRGSISGAHECLKDTDVVVGIEIIEHLHADVLEGVPPNVFGYMRPKVAMFSTPNSEYNVHFDGLLENGFRHEDHKFEWTRAEFAAWCEDILRRYPEYVVKYFGIGPPPKNSPDDVGYVSQLAVFVRKDFLDEIKVLNIAQDNAPTVATESAPTPAEASGSAESKIYFDEEVGEIVMSRDEKEEHPPVVLPSPAGVFRDDVEDLESPEVDDDLEGSDHDEPNERMIDFYIPVERARNDSGNYDDEPLDPTSDEYKLLCSVDYPVQEADRRERPEKLLDEAEVQIRKLKFHEENYFNYEQNQYRIPLQLVVDCMVNIPSTVEEMRPLLTEASYRVSDDGMIVVTGDDESFGSDDDFEYDLDANEEQAAGEEAEDRWAVEEGQQPARASDESQQGTSFQEDEELWD